MTRGGCRFVRYVMLPIPEQLIQSFRTQPARRELHLPAVVPVVWLNTLLRLPAELPDKKL